MKQPDRLLGKVLLSAALFGATKIALKGTEGAWAAVTDDTPPPKKKDQVVNIQEEVAWVLLSGAVVGLIRLLVRRSIPEDL